MTEKITNAPVLICTAVQIKNSRYIYLVSADHNDAICSVI